jgi:hypothetical protein
MFKLEDRLTGQTLRTILPSIDIHTLLSTSDKQCAFLFDLGLKSARHNERQHAPFQAEKLKNA